MKLKTIIFINRAPFKELKLSFDSSISVLVGINGKGKTTIISHIVDALYELAKLDFHNEFKNKDNQFYRFSSAIYSIDRTKPSIVYLRFVGQDGKNIDYVDIQGKCSEQEYNKLIDFSDRIPYSNMRIKIVDSISVKHWSISKDKAGQTLFDNNILTYFPAYRYELPIYLNNPFKLEMKYNYSNHITGYLPNPIEINDNIQKIANWIMDTVLDYQLYKDSKQNITGNAFLYINSIIRCILYSKTSNSIRLGIGQRFYGAQRIQVVDDEEEKVIYPSIFSMSSGELELLCTFGEVIRQADRLGREPKDITGIVLIDEVEKHLHITLQKEVLPQLIASFPKIQFILASHSPFFSLGLKDVQEKQKDTGFSYKIYDLDNGGVCCEPQNNELFREAYETMIEENERFAEKLQDLQKIVQEGTKPLIITEGKTDWKHLKVAMAALNINDIDIDFLEYNNTMGNTELIKLLRTCSYIPQGRKIIGIFDRDDETVFKEFPTLNTEEFIELTNNVFAFAIPKVHEDQYGVYTSIEHYYNKNDLTKKAPNGNRLFLGEEFYTSGNSIDGLFQTKTSNIQNKVKLNGVIDEKVFMSSDLQQEKSIALSKNDFAELIYKRDEYAKEFDFSAFNKIFAIVRKIIMLQ